MVAASEIIEVVRTGNSEPPEFEVVVHDSGGETRHHVSIDRATSERLTAEGYTPQRWLEAAFRFLLDREPKESILGRFNLSAISKYFPEFERELPRYLSDR